MADNMKLAITKNNKRPFTRTLILCILTAIRYPRLKPSDR
jgi:hypothetical protein